MLIYVYYGNILLNVNIIILTDRKNVFIMLQNDTFRKLLNVRNIVQMFKNKKGKSITVTVFP